MFQRAERKSEVCFALTFSSDAPTTELCNTRTGTPGVILANYLPTRAYMGVESIRGPFTCTAMPSFALNILRITTGDITKYITNSMQNEVQIHILKTSKNQLSGF